MPSTINVCGQRVLGHSHSVRKQASRLLCSAPIPATGASIHYERDLISPDVRYGGYIVDQSNGYEGVAREFLARRGSGRSTGVGVKAVRAWARTMPRGAAVIDLGCGPGFPITEVLVAEGFSVFGVDAAPTFVEAFRRNLPITPVVCEAVQDSKFFDRTFDGVLAWGLIFLLSVEDQRRLIQKMAGQLTPGGRLLFTSPAEPIVWTDAMTGLESRSLGAEEYRRYLSAVGLSVTSEYEDEGQNHYFDAVKGAIGLRADSLESK
jgi:SAM-dependent methyltransferase